jgi:glycine/D-amino acid oxidase-like deaminating enzyme
MSRLRIVVIGAGAMGLAHLVLQGTDLDRTATPDVEPAVDGSIGVELLRRARERLAGLYGTPLAEVRLAVRSIPADGLPVVGWVPEAEGGYVVATHSGYTLALELARLVADEVGGAQSTTLDRFRPARFGTEPTPAAVR